MSHNAILQNSPALHSLKREQLVKLCKKHALKANGKNIELIERLKQHGSGLPPEALGYCWEDSDDDEQDDPASPTPANNTTRPSEQWEMVMENIPEAEENGMSAMSTLTLTKSPGAAGEFGTGGSKNSVKSSLKAAFASSFGIKRSGSNTSSGKTDSNDDATARPSGAGPFDFPQSPEYEPLPGTASKRGVPAPPNARLSVTSVPGVTATIRLIPSEATLAPDMPTPPRLTPFRTTFDIDLSSPDGGKKRPVWPASPMTGTSTKRLYPAIPYEDIASSPFKSNFGTPVAPAIKVLEATPNKSPIPRPMPSDAVDDVFSPAKPALSEKKDAKKETRLSMPSHQPYLFGSPIAQPTFGNKQFDAAAASVLEEMNKRLEEAGVQKVEKTVLDPSDKAKATASGARRINSDVPGANRFAKAHEEAFSKMDSIANHYAARRPPPAPSANAAVGTKRKSEVAGLGHGPAPIMQRKTSVAETRVISTGVRKKMGIPGGFGDDGNQEDEQEEDAGDHRSSKRIRVTSNDDVHKGKKLSLLATQKTEEEVRKQEKEREAVRRHLNAARRRSSLGRASLASKAVAPSPKPRLGLLASAKSLVRNVWNMGAKGGKTTDEASKQASKLPSMADYAKSARTVSSTLPKSSTTGKIPQPSLLDASKARTVSSGNSENTANRSARRRSPIPSFEPPKPSAIAPRSNTPGGTAPLNLKPRSTSLASNRAKGPLPSGGVSSLGARTAVAGPSKTSSIGTMRSPVQAGDQGSDAGKSAVAPRKRTISTLMQPTASSMARQQSKPSESSRVLSPSTLHQITNSPCSPTPSQLQPPKVFTKALTTQTFGSPVKPASSQNVPSLAAAATSMLENASPAKPMPRKALPLSAQKPRVSRTKAVAKLGHHRGVSVSSVSSVVSSNASPRVRSSAGATPKRSLAPMKNQRMSANSEALKKRARQSELARRKARVVVGSNGVAMDVDR